MQIVIPMSGFGERFRCAGYAVPKPLIEIDGKPIIAHVIDMFPDEQDFLFICNSDHLANPAYRMEEILKQYCPTGRIIAIPPHKLGPVYAVQQVQNRIDDALPVVVNYCDFACFWDWKHFKVFVEKTRCAGSIPAYKGFHPNSLGTTNYAYMRETGGWVEDIQEKKPYTDDRMNEFASSGTYYFATGKLMKEAFRKTIEQNLNIGGEYYVSLAYKYLLGMKMPVAVYPLQHFMQWGTPEDVAEYRRWSDAFRVLIEPKKEPFLARGAFVVPMAGLGQRFANGGYKMPKPLIPVSGRPMIVNAVETLPAASQQAFVVRSDMPGCHEVEAELKKLYPEAVIEEIPSVTDGQARTALIGLDALERALGPVSEPITFGACDSGMLYDRKGFRDLFDNPETDVVVWGVRGHVNALRRPEMFGWIDAEDGRIRHISVKKPLTSPINDPIVLGCFTFRRAGDFRRAVERLIAREGKINNEYYIDACINDALELGMTCRLFEVDHFFSWGTPDELKTFEYWQSCFHKWESHPYRLNLDMGIPREKVFGLEERYRAIVPDIVGPPSC